MLDAEDPQIGLRPGSRRSAKPGIAQGSWLVGRLAAVTTFVLEVAAVDTAISMPGVAWQPSPAQAAPR